jgi:cytochrome P450
MKFKFTSEMTDVELIQMYKILRRDYPILWSEDHECWVISRYNDVVNGLSDYSIFTYKNIDAVVGRDLLSLTNKTDTSSFSIDLPPDYQRKRKALMNIYQDAISNGIEEKIYINITNLFNLQKNKGEFDLIKNVTNIIPIYTICEIIGYDYSNSKDMFQIISKLWEKNDVNTRISLCRDAYNFIISNKPEMLKKTIYNKEDIISFIIGVFLGGSNSLTGTMPSIAYYSNIYKKEFEKTFKNEKNKNNFIQESLRHALIQSHLIRTADKDIQLYNKQILKGQRVAFLIGSANFDEQKFGPDADTFCINRNFNKINLVFGHGMYRCIGASLANIQLKCFLDFIINNNIKVKNFSLKKERNFTGTLIENLIVEFS